MKIFNMIRSYLVSPRNPRLNAPRHEHRQEDNADKNGYQDYYKNKDAKGLT